MVAGYLSMGGCSTTMLAKMSTIDRLVGVWVAWIGSYLLILVGALEHGFYFSIELGMSSSQLTNSMIFQRGGEKPPTRLS